MAVATVWIRNVRNKLNRENNAITHPLLQTAGYATACGLAAMMA